MALLLRSGTYGNYWGDEQNSAHYLTMDQMKVNATYIFNALIDKGWTINAICGLLGNTQSESNHNPGLWENLSVGNTSKGYGLVQWTPATKYIDWVASGVDYSTMDSNISRIEYEIEHNLQWYPTQMYNLTFKQFIKSEEDPRYLAEAFLYNYERPTIPKPVERGTQALYWYEFLSGSVYKKRGFPWAIYFNRIRDRRND